jgi:hypothetical protein
MATRIGSWNFAIQPYMQSLLDPSSHMMQRSKAWKATEGGDVACSGKQANGQDRQ